MIVILSAAAIILLVDFFMNRSKREYANIKHIQDAIAVLQDKRSMLVDKDEINANERSIRDLENKLSDELA